MNEGSEESRSGSRSLERALDILLALAEAPGDLGVTALAEKMRISKGTIHRLLQTLVMRGFVAFNPHTKEYRLAGKALQIGLSVEGRMELYTESAPILEKLSIHTGETAALYVGIGKQLLPVAQYASRQFPRKIIRLGMAFPLHAGAIGRVALAFHSNAFIDSYLESLSEDEPFPIGDVAALKTNLASIRSKGYELNLDEHGISVHSVAFPLLNARGQLIGGINIFGPPERWTRQVMEASILGCQEIIEEVSSHLRYLSPFSGDEELGDLLPLTGGL